MTKHRFKEAKKSGVLQILACLSSLRQEWMKVTSSSLTLATGRQVDATLARSEALLAPDERMPP